MADSTSKRSPSIEDRSQYGAPNASTTSPWDSAATRVAYVPTSTRFSGSGSTSVSDESSWDMHGSVCMPGDSSSRRTIRHAPALLLRPGILQCDGPVEDRL